MKVSTLYSPDDINARIRAAIGFVNSRIINRVEVVDQIFCALLVREHALLQSRTGAAKSLLAQQIFAMFDGADLFQVQASKEQQPDTYFGGLDIEELKKGRIAHNTEKSLIESEFGFIDEIFDANDYTLRALLTTLNERSLILGAQVVPARVHTVIAATNYLRVSEVTEAVLDRFLFKSLFLPNKDPYVQYQIAMRYLEHGGKAVAPPERIPYLMLHRTSRIIKGEDQELTIHIPLRVIFFTNAVLRHYEMQRNRVIAERPHDHPQIKDYYISPRTQARAIDVLRAIAFLHGRMEVVIEDVRQLWHAYTVVGMDDQKELFLRSYETMIQQYSAAGAFEQIEEMLEFQELLEVLRRDPSLLQQPVTEITSHPLKRSFVEWAKEKLGLSDSVVENNRRLLEGFVQNLVPRTEEIHELKRQQERDVRELFHPSSHVWS